MPNHPMPSTVASSDTSLVGLSIAEALEGLRNGQFSALELTQAHLNRAQETRDLNCFIEITQERALADARTSDQRYKEGTARGLEGIPLGNKDIFCTQGHATTAASHILKDFVPPYESTISGRLKAAGMVMMGKLNMDEFAMGSSNQTSYYGPCFNPWGGKINEPELLPGGSSGGSAAAVAARCVMAATGTDTGGSVRQPASFCGIVGLKPTYGLCSRFGVMAFASSLDHPGPLTRTVEDAALMLQHMAGHDPRESTSLNKPVPDYLATLKNAIKGKRIGIPKEYNLQGLDDDIKKLWEQAQRWLTEEGAIVEEISLPHARFALPVYYVIMPAEASSNLARYDGVRYGLRVEGATLDELYENTRAEGFGPEVQRRIFIGTHVLSAGSYEAYFLQATKVRSLIWQDFVAAFNKVDMILTPSAPTPAFTQATAPRDPLQMYLNDVFTVTANLAGIPAISVPAGLSTSGLPLGMQLMAPPLQEASLLNVAHILEQKANFDLL